MAQLNSLRQLYNGSGFTLHYVPSGNRKVLATGLSNFTFHFEPSSSRRFINASQMTMGFVSLWGITYDYKAGLNIGDIIVVTTLRGEIVSPFEFYVVRGTSEYPSWFLPHGTAVLEKYEQS